MNNNNNGKQSNKLCKFPYILKIVPAFWILFFAKFSLELGLNSFFEVWKNIFSQFCIVITIEIKTVDSRTDYIFDYCLEMNWKIQLIVQITQFHLLLTATTHQKIIVLLTLTCNMTNYLIQHLLFNRWRDYFRVLQTKGRRLTWYQ